MKNVNVWDVEMENLFNTYFKTPSLYIMLVSFIFWGKKDLYPFQQQQQQHQKSLKIIFNN